MTDERKEKLLERLRHYENCDHEWRAVITREGYPGKECVHCRVTSYNSKWVKP